MADSSMRLLVVDDELEMLEVFYDALARIPALHVVAESSGLVALNLLRCQPFDLLVTDLRLPRIDGLQLIEHARDLVPAMPILVVTGYPTAENAGRCRELGAVGYLRKPFAPATLIALVSQVLGLDQADRTT